MAPWRLTPERADLDGWTPEIVFLGEDGAGGVTNIRDQTTVGSVGCPECGVPTWVKDRSRVEPVDPPLGRPTRHKRRWACPDVDCKFVSWTEEDDRIAGSCQAHRERHRCHPPRGPSTDTRLYPLASI